MVIMKLTIPRDKWERGNGQGLLWNRTTDCGCALGHYGLALGYSKADLIGNGTPCEVFVDDDDMLCRWPNWLVTEHYDESLDDDPMYTDSHTADVIITANDSDGLTDQEREAKLVELFAGKGVELEFV